MNTIYIYGLVYKRKVFYIGSSKNPVKRFLQHLSLKTGEYWNKKDSITEVDIKIIDQIPSNAKEIGIDRKTVEYSWMAHYKNLNHPLQNKVQNRMLPLSEKRERCPFCGRMVRFLDGHMKSSHQGWISRETLARNDLDVDVEELAKLISKNKSRKG